MFSIQTYRLQAIRFPSGHLSYSVLDAHYRPVPAIDGFLAYLDATDKSPNTIRAYGRGLTWYFTFLTERGVAWEDVSLDDIARFIAWLRAPATNVIITDISAARVSNRTINLYLAAVTGFYEYQVRNGCDVADRLSVWRNITRRCYKGFLGHITPRQPLRKSAIRLPESVSRPDAWTTSMRQ